ncbi:MAG: hypothetical protein NT023_20610 [Armatimonadetes bacterium]|nr:hypothetical protein [Armatimonadota bacterium]
MTITIELTPEEEARLRAQAEKAGSDIATFARKCLMGESEGQTWGSRMLAQWTEEGIIGMWAEREDIEETCRKFREGRLIMTEGEG